MQRRSAAFLVILAHCGSSNEPGSDSDAAIHDAPVDAVQCQSGPSATVLPMPQAGENYLWLCSDYGAGSCPEVANVFPDRHALDISGTTYTDSIPDTLDLATWAAEYYHGTLRLMIPTDFIQTLKTIPVPPGSYAAGWYVLYHSILTPEGARQTCSGVDGPCVNAEYVPQWAITLQSLRRAREMIGNEVAEDDATREWLSVRGVFGYDALMSTPPDASRPGDANNTFSYTMMLLADLYREYPGNAGVTTLMNEYIRFKSTTVGPDPTYAYWLNFLASQYSIGFDGRGGYYNDNFVRLHHQANNGVPLSDWAELTGDATATGLGHKTAAYLLGYQSGVFWANPNTQPANAGRFTADPPVEFVGHTLSYATALDAMLSDARMRTSTNAADPVAAQEVMFVKNAYEFAKRRGNAGLLGNFGVSSYLGEMLRLGIKLEHFRTVYPDVIPFSQYYEDVERWTRNQAAEDRIDATVATYIPDTPDPGGDPRFDHIGSRAVGTFLSNATHVRAIPFNTFEDDNDGLWLMRGLYDVWKNTVEITMTGGKTVGWVNLLLNRAAPSMDVYSDIPYRGRVVVAMHRNSGIDQLAVRIPSWRGGDVTITEDTGSGPSPIAQGQRWSLKDGYVTIDGIRPGAAYAVQFPMISQRLTVTQLYGPQDWWYEGDYAGQGFPELNGQFGATFLGDVMVQADGQDAGVPRYQRLDLAALIGAGGVTEVDPPRRSVSRFVRTCALPSMTESGL